MNGAVWFHVAGQIWNCLACPILLWGFCEHNLWSEASNQLSQQPPPLPPCSSLNSSNLWSSCSSETVLGVGDMKGPWSLHIVAIANNLNLPFDLSSYFTHVFLKSHEVSLCFTTSSTAIRVSPTKNLCRENTGAPSLMQHITAFHLDWLPLRPKSPTSTDQTVP